MPTYKGVEVWIEDSNQRKLSHQELTINLVDSDDRTVTVKTEMLKDELYTVHCLSPISVFCDVFVTTASRVRKSAARFYLNKNLAVSENASGSSADHTVGQFRDHGLRTPKRQFHDGSNMKLNIVEVEIRRIADIIKGELREESEADGDEGVVTDFILIDHPDQPPWLVFRFDIRSLAVPASTAEHIRKHRAPRRTLTDQNQATGRSQPVASSTGSSNETSRGAGYESSYRSKKRLREYDGRDGSSDVGENPIDTNLNSDLLLVQEYQKEEAEERRLLQKLQERLQTKKARNMELRILLGETA